jgi:hypothetical protein
MKLGCLSSSLLLLGDGPFNALGIVFFEMTIAVDDTIFTDGFESGDTSAWSTTVP